MKTLKVSVPQPPPLPEALASLLQHYNFKHISSQTQFNPVTGAQDTIMRFWSKAGLAVSVCTDRGILYVSQATNDYGVGGPQVSPQPLHAPSHYLYNNTEALSGLLSEFFGRGTSGVILNDAN